MMLFDIGFGDGIFNSTRLTTLFLITVALVIFAVVRVSTRPVNTNSQIPTYSPASSSSRKRWLFDSVALLQEAYRKFPGRPFQIATTEGNQVVIPADLIDEVKMLPDHTFPSALRSFFLHEYIWPIESSKLDYGHAVVKHDLNKSMSKVFPTMRDEVTTVLDIEFPEAQDWTPVKVYPKVLRVVSRVNGRIFVGEGLHRNPEWIDISCNYTRIIFMTSAKLRFFPPFVRPVAQFLVPELRQLRQYNRRAKELLAPILQERQEQEAAGDYKKPNDAIEWLRDITPEPDKNDPHFHGISQLGIGAVSVNTTSQLLTNALFNLATYPEYSDMLRSEMTSVLQAHDGQWTLDSMSALVKTDSFLKETLRHSGHLSATFQRQALKPIALSDGTTIDAGTFTFAPTNAINFDPSIYPNPDVFDGLRFYNLRSAKEEDRNKFQLTSVTKTQLQFGSGRHACPGRWFASHEVKLVLSAILERYDVRLKDGQSRPTGMLYQTNQLPDVKAEILFRARRQ